MTNGLEISLSAPESAPSLPTSSEKVEVFETQEGVGRVRAEIDRLRAQDRIATPNADPERFLATARGLGGGVRPYVAVFRNGEGVATAAIVGRSSSRRTG